MLIRLRGLFREDFKNVHGEIRDLLIKTLDNRLPQGKSDPNCFTAVAQCAYRKLLFDSGLQVRVLQVFFDLLIAIFLIPVGIEDRLPAKRIRGLDRKHPESEFDEHSLVEQGAFCFILVANHIKDLRYEFVYVSLVDELLHICTSAEKVVMKLRSDAHYQTGLVELNQLVFVCMEQHGDHYDVIVHILKVVAKLNVDFNQVPCFGNSVYGSELVKKF